MINEILLQFIAEYHQGLNELAGRGKATEQALTAIYEIGLGVIGEDLPMDSSDRRGNPKYSFKNLVINEKLAYQRKAWAKACGVEDV